MNVCEKREREKKGIVRRRSTRKRRFHPEFRIQGHVNNAKEAKSKPPTPGLMREKEDRKGVYKAELG